MSWICSGFRLRFVNNVVPPAAELANHRTALRCSDFVTTAVQECLQMGALRQWKGKGKPHFVLPLMVDDSRDKLRLIFNGKWLNQFLEFPKFKYEGLQPFVDVLHSDDGLFYFDYTSGYYHVELHESSRRYVAITLCFGRMTVNDGCHLPYKAL